MEDSVLSRCHFFFSSTWYINSDVISVKVPGNLFLDIDKLILKYLYGETKDPKELSIEREEQSWQTPLTKT